MPGYLPLESPLSPTAPCAKWLRYPIGTCANQLSTATGDYIITTMTTTNVTLDDLNNTSHLRDAAADLLLYYTAQRIGHVAVASSG